MKESKTLRNLIVLYKMGKKFKCDPGLFRFQLSRELLGREMDCFIEAYDIMKRATMQEISVNYTTVYMK